MMSQASLNFSAVTMQALVSVMSFLDLHCPSRCQHGGNQEEDAGHEGGEGQPDGQM